MPHARRIPLPSSTARPGGGRARPLDRLSRRPARDGRRPRVGPRRGRGDGERVGPGRDRRRRPGRGPRGPHPSARVDAGVVAAATLRPPPPGGPRMARRPVAEEPHRERGGGRARPHAAHRALRHAHRPVHARGDRVGAGPRVGPSRPRRRAPWPRRAGRADGRGLLAGGPSAARRRARARAGGTSRPRGNAVARARAPGPLARCAPARQRLLAPDRAASGRLRPGRDGQPRGVHRRDGAARRAQPRGAAAEPIERARPLLAPGARAADRARQRRSRMTRRRTLRTLVEAKQGLIVPGAYDAISAKLVQQAGFPAVYMTGYGTSASRLGLPDLGFAGLAEMVDHARNLVAVLDVPLIADADTGYGNALNVRRTVQMYEAAGVAALHIEDQVTPKRCGHLSGHQVIPRAEFTGKIRAAVEVRTDPDLLVIARTDAISAVDADEALRRGEAAAKAGADVLFIEAPRSEAAVESVARAFDTPLLYNYAPGGRSPLLPFARLRELGFAVILLPVDTLLVAVQAIRGFLAAAKARDDVQALKDRYMPFRDFNELIGVNAQLALAERYTDDARSAT